MNRSTHVAVSCRATRLEIRRLGRIHIRHPPAIPQKDQGIPFCYYRNADIGQPSFSTPQADRDQAYQARIREEEKFGLLDKVQQSLQTGSLLKNNRAAGEPGALPGQPAGRRRLTILRFSPRFAQPAG